jgi:hypothetical protein
MSEKLIKRLRTRAKQYMTAQLYDQASLLTEAADALSTPPASQESASSVSELVVSAPATAWAEGQLLSVPATTVAQESAGEAVSREQHDAALRFQHENSTRIQQEFIARIATLTAERDQSDARLHEVAVACATAEQERDRLQGEVERLREDAARYQWLRGRNNSLETRQYDKGVVNGPSCYHEVEGIRELKWEDALDAAVDAARDAALSAGEQK